MDVAHSERFQVAAIQMSSQANVEENRSTAVTLIKSAAQAGAQLIVLPELFTCLGTAEDTATAAESLTGPTISALQEIAQRSQVAIVAGSIPEQPAADAGLGKLVYNSTVAISAAGEVVAVYRKMHLFDVDVPDRVTYRESDFLAAGDQVVVTELAGLRVGLGICYDLRFPELFRKLAESECDLICLPAAFAMGTGRDHWEVLLRARAIENQCFVVAANQIGQHPSGLHTYGRSQIIDPWGTVLATAADEVGIVTAQLRLARLGEIRSQLPALRHRRL